jgi:hypothetical protein
VKRWTLLVIPHDTEQPRSVALSERALRWAGIGLGVLLVSGLVGMAAVARWAVQPRGEDAQAIRAAAREALLDSLRSNEVDSLRQTVQALDGTMRTIRSAEARLSAASGLGPTDRTALRAHADLPRTRAAADSLLRGATVVARKIEAMADSAQRGPQRGPHRVPQRSGRSPAGRSQR